MSDFRAWIIISTANSDWSKKAQAVMVADGMERKFIFREMVVCGRINGWKNTSMPQGGKWNQMHQQRQM
jgi:hypothetical protein